MPITLIYFAGKCLRLVFLATNLLLAFLLHLLAAIIIIIIIIFEYAYDLTYQT